MYENWHFDQLMILPRENKVKIDDADLHHAWTVALATN